MADIVLTGDTSGAITVAAPAVAGTNTLTLPASTGTIITDTAPKAGNILQVVQTVKTDTFSTTSTSFVDITGLSVTITPSSASSKILVRFASHISNSGFLTYLDLLRDSTSIILGDAASSRPRITTTSASYSTSTSVDYNITQASMEFLDSPSTTSAITYKLQMRSYQSAQTAYLNRTPVDRDTADFEPRTPSTITVMEVAG